MDDDANCRSAIGDIVASELPEAEIYQADSARVAVWEILQQPVDIVITDFYMPEMDGGCLSERLRAARFSGWIIVISGDPDVADVIAKCGASGFVYKMRMVEELPLRLREVFGDDASKSNE